jgi:hypothetical protein
VDDDGTGWNEVLLSLWGDDTRDAVVARIERVATSRRGWLVRVFSDPDRVRPNLTETVHQLVLAAIQDETGADLEALGSQAAWDCYEQVWDALAARWSDGGALVAVPLGREPEVVRLLAQLPPEGAVSAGADVGDGGVQPLWLRGRLLLDPDGLRGYLALDGGRVPAAIHDTAQALLRAVR